MWQVLNPDSWFDPAGGQEKLVPFHNDFGGERHVDYFNSDDVRAYSTFGYEYDVLVRQKGQEDEEYVAGITSHINKTYHGTGDVLQHDKGGLFLSGQLGGGDKDYEDYVINVLYDRYGYEDGAPYTIHFFFREAPAEADVRAGDRMIHEFPGHVGSISTFSSPVETVGQGEDNTLHCAKCARQRDEGVLSRASVSLTISLYKDAVNKNIDAIGDLTPSTVETYLKDGLTWVAVSMEGRFIPWNELDKTKVFILQGTSEQPTDNNIFSTYRSYTSMPAATDGKEAGASKQDYKDFETGRLSMRV
ncbi:hypothetical protein COL26b_002100 [Colletotrichum chrysophilum]|nr:uncharacterized protein COL26b_002100 [Colletotrichum chrysophilum]KAJ0379592.1 hypothetical protein COL26b_002100 [Colletotrichum chrysophilum]